jgi:hypothetical protein
MPHVEHQQFALLLASLPRLSMGEVNKIHMFFILFSIEYLAKFGGFVAIVAVDLNTDK